MNKELIQKVADAIHEKTGCYPSDGGETAEHIIELVTDDIIKSIGNYCFHSEQEICEHVVFLWQTYALESNDKLSGEAKILAENLREWLKPIAGKQALATIEEMEK